MKMLLYLVGMKDPKQIRLQHELIESNRLASSARKFAPTALNKSSFDEIKRESREVVRSNLPSKPVSAREHVETNRSITSTRIAPIPSNKPNLDGGNKESRYNNIVHSKQSGEVVRNKVLLKSVLAREEELIELDRKISIRNRHFHGPSNKAGLSRRLVLMKLEEQPGFDCDSKYNKNCVANHNDLLGKMNDIL